MDKVKIFYLSMKPGIPANDYWIYGMLNDLIEGDRLEVSKLEKTRSAVVVVPGEYHAHLVNEINIELSKIENVVLFIMADEEGKFPVERIEHPSAHIWVQCPRPGRHDKYNKLGSGYPPQSQRILPELSPEKDTDLFFSGQVTHTRRIELQENLKSAHEWGIDTDQNYTQGFTQGFEHEDYYQRLAKAKIAPAPSGPNTPDSFRAYEALEAMCVLIADERDPIGHVDGYWDWLFGDNCPFYKAKEWDNIISWAKEAKENWPHNVHKQTAWWIKQKRNFANRVMEQLNESN